MPVLSETYGPAVAYKYQNVAAILASTTTYSDHTAGDEVRTEDEDFRYIVAATGATDHQIENAAGTPVKFYVQPKDGEYHFAAWGADDTGVTSARDDFLAAGELAAANNLPLVVEGHSLIDGSNLFFDIPARNELTLRSNTGAIVRTTTPNIFFRDEGDKFSENLAADIARYDRQVTVADTADVKQGDFVQIHNSQSRIETSWSYDKYCTRRVNRVLDTTTIELDQAMDIPFETIEGNKAVTGSGYDHNITGITKANPGVVTVTTLNMVEGDYVRFRSMVGMTEIEDPTLYRVGPVSGNAFDLHDSANSPVDTSAYGTFTSGEAYKQAATTVAVHPPAKVKIDNINFLVGVEKHLITAFDVSTGVITTGTNHGMTTGGYGSLYELGGSTEANDTEYRVERLSDTTFSLRDLDNVAIDTTGWTTYTSGGYLYTSSGISFESKIAFDGVEGVVTRSSFVGPVPYWLTGSVDTAEVSQCDDFIFDLCHFERGRYCPLIQSGSRNTRVTRSTTKKIRHIELAAWAQDSLIEDVTGIDTHGIIQSHPCIRTIWRRVRDFNTSTSTAAINIRGAGEIVEDCDTDMHDGVVGVGTNNYTPHSFYEDWAASFTRRISGLRSRTIAPSSGNGPFTVERCDVPYISEGLASEVYVDEQTTFNGTFDRSRASEFANIIMTGRANVPTISAYTSERRSVTITGATQANPCVITATGHGLETGDTVTIEDVVGMTELNDSSYTITYVDANSFSLDGEDSTGHTAYTSGGEAWADPTVRTITGITQADPAVVTSTAHGFSDGEVVWIADVAGMTEVNTSYFIVAGATANTFELTTLAGANVDSTGYTPYSADGNAIRQQSFTTVDLATKPNVGTGRVAMTTSQLYSESAHSALTVTTPFFLRYTKEGATVQNHHHVQIKLKAKTRGGYAEAQYNMIRDIQNTASNYNFIEAGGTLTMGGAAVRLKGIDFRDLDTVKNEGGLSSALALATGANERWGVTGAVEVTVDATADFILSLDMELDVRIS